MPRPKISQEQREAEKKKKDRSNNRFKIIIGYCIIDTTKGTDNLFFEGGAVYENCGPGVVQVVHHAMLENQESINKGLKPAMDALVAMGDDLLLPGKS